MNETTELTEYELNTKIGERVKENLEKLKITLAKELHDIVWTACNDYVEYAEWEPMNNWKDRERHSLVGAKYMLHKDCFWGKQMRAKTFEEHKDVIIPIIKDEQFEAMQKRIAELEEDLKRERELARNRISY